MNVFVGCSSRDTLNETYLNVARKIGEYIASNNFNLVFGACENGLMGELYRTIKSISGTKSKIIVAMSKQYEYQLNGIIYNELHTYETMSTRKEALINLSDVIVILPGGLGSIDEMITAIESKRNGEHNKPIVIVNVNNFYDSIFKLIDKCCEEGFMSSESKNLYYVANTVEEAIVFLKNLYDKNFKALDKF